MENVKQLEFKRSNGNHSFVKWVHAKNNVNVNSKWYKQYVRMVYQTTDGDWEITSFQDNGEKIQFIDEEAASQFAYKDIQYEHTQFLKTLNPIVSNKRSFIQKLKHLFEYGTFK